MKTASRMLSYTVNGDSRSAIIIRNDRSWGHALDAEVFDSVGTLLNQVSFACHPEFKDFEHFQSKNTDELVRIAVERLRSAEVESSLAAVRAVGLRLMLRFNDPEKHAA